MKHLPSFLKMLPDLAETPSNREIRKCRALVLGVAGVNIAEIAGCICFLERNCILPKFERILGSSSSSFLALALILSQSRRISFRNYIEDLFEQVKDRPFYDGINPITEWYWKGIISKGIRCRILEHLYSFFSLPSSLTFADLFHETKTYFFTNGLCLDEKENYYFSYLTTPKMEIYSCLMSISSVIPFCLSSELLFPDGKKRRIYDPGCGPRFCPGAFLSSSSLYSLMNDNFFSSSSYSPMKENEILSIVLLPSLDQPEDSISFPKKLIQYTLEKCWYDQRNLYPKMKTILIPHQRYTFPSSEILCFSFLQGQRCCLELCKREEFSHIKV